MKNAICWECARDEFLKRTIKDNGALIECSLCHKSSAAAFDAEQLADRVEPILREHFEPGTGTEIFGDDDEQLPVQAGDPLANAIEMVLGQYLPFEDQIVQALICAENRRQPLEESTRFFVAWCNYVERPTAFYYRAKWEAVERELNHKNRFFSTSARKLFDALFRDIEILRSGDENDENVVWKRPENSRLFRARHFREGQSLKEFYADPYKHIGPPPPGRTRAGRMNAEGVVLFYGAREHLTCLAEMRPYLLGQIVTIDLRTTRPLRLIDFTRLGKSSPRKTLSFFEPDFTEQVRRGDFLRRLQSLISRPVTPDRESNYLITQTMAEYLAHVHAEPFDGILYESAQLAGGTNIVLFPSSSGEVSVASEFPLAYIDGSLRLFVTNSIEYGYAERNIESFNGEVWAEELIDHAGYM